MSPAQPTECPHCGAVGEMQPQYTTGAGWRVSDYRCRKCGERVEATAVRADRYSRRAKVTALSLALAAAVAVAALVRRRGD